MSTEIPSKRIRTDSVVKPLEGRFSDSSLTSRSNSTPLPMAVDLNRENDTGASNLVPEMTPIVDGHDHAPHVVPPRASVPVSSSIPYVGSTSPAPEYLSTSTSPSNANSSGSAFQGAHVYMDRPIVANTIHWHASGNEQSKSQILVSKNINSINNTERLPSHRYLQSTRSDLIDSGIYIGDPSNSFRQGVEWKRHGHGNYLVFKEADSCRETESSDSAQELKPATLSVVVQSSYDDCWLTPCGNWKGPTQVTKNFADLKLSFLGERPTKFDVFQKDYTYILSNVKWLMQQINVSNLKAKGLLTTSRGGVTDCLKFRHVLFEKIQVEEDSSDTASESDQDDTYNIANWPVIHSEAAEARDSLIESHRVVPLPLYDTAGRLIAPSRYKDSVAGALVRVNFSLTHWFIPASGSFEAANTFVADIKSVKILVDATPLKSLKRRRTEREEPVFVSPLKRSKKRDL